MGGYDDHVAIMGDWMPPSPNPRPFFTSMNGDDSINENKNGPHFLVPDGNDSSRKDYQYDITQAPLEGEVTNNSNGPKMGSRASLKERLAARAGFNAPRLNTESIRPADVAKNPEILSPYLTIPPGLSPTTLLDSPVFLNNSSVLPSPTTGKFSFAPSGNNRNPTFMRDDRDKGKENNFEDASLFAFKPTPESGSFPYFNATNKGYPSGFAPPLDMPLMHQSFGALIGPTNFNKSHVEKNIDSNLSPEETYNSVVAENSPPLDEPPDDDGVDQRSNGDPHGGGAPSEDGYNWRKYGQKQVKGSEFPRSYFKCTHPNCPVKKKVERSFEGHITEIIYKGAHNHTKPPLNRRSGLGPTNGLGDVQPNSEQTGAGLNGDHIWKGGNLESTSMGPLGQDCNSGATLRPRYETVDGVDMSSAFSNDEDEDDDDRATHGSVSLGYDGEGDESESKRRRIETYASEMSGNTRAIREPRVVVQTTSEVDILDDGYRWRKYGQKVVKGNPNPRSYYKCTSPGCNVRKHVERACHDLKSVITTYEGKHNHDVPAARNSSHASSVGPTHNQQAPSAGSSHIHRPESSQINMAHFERGQLGYPNRPMGRAPPFGFGMSQQGLASLAMAGLGHSQGRLPAHMFFGHHQARPMNDVAFMMPKVEPKVEPVANSGLNPSDETSAYQQFMNLGPQM